MTLAAAADAAASLAFSADARGLELGRGSRCWATLAAAAAATNRAFSADAMGLELGLRSTCWATLAAAAATSRLQIYGSPVIIVHDREVARSGGDWGCVVTSSSCERFMLGCMRL